MASIDGVSVAESVLPKVGLSASVGGGATAFIGGVTLNEAAMIVGMAVGLVGLLIQLIVQAHSVIVRERQDRRDALEHAARMEEILAGKAERRTEGRHGNE